MNRSTLGQFQLGTTTIVDHHQDYLAMHLIRDIFDVNDI